MRRTIVCLVSALLVAGLVAAPATAKKKKKAVHVQDSIEARLLPFPKLASWGDLVGITKPGCSAGQEGTHWVGEEFTAPGKGTLRFHTENFTGDWDLYMFMGDTLIARSDEPQVNLTAPAEPAPPEEEIKLPMKTGQKVLLVVCNWMGHPDVKALYEGHFIR
ncbi:MAG: hypothetical protein ABR575_04560 [Actinomycetota bacterium]